ncbi:MAG: RNA polymerase sigma factor [Ferruginibacter sp.]|nr:RNA polymerase sigma factor [Cytophagales bacterium]
MNPELDKQLLELLRICAQADRTGQEVLYRRFYGYAMSVCLRYSRSRDEALEILNDGFLKVFTRIDKYDPARSFKGWLRKILINTALDHYRKHRRQYQTEQHSVGESGATQFVDAAGNVLNRLAYEDLLALVQQLSPAYRTVFNLYVMDGYSHEEIAEALEISVGTSKSNLSKARANLQGKIKKNNQDEYARRR